VSVTNLPESTAQSNKAYAGFLSHSTQNYVAG